MLNIGAMKLITYVFFGVMFLLSVKDFNEYSKKDKKTTEKEDLLIKYIHKVELRIGIILFFVMINILVGLKCL